MIKIELTRKNDCDYFYSLRFLGHCDFAEKGNDIVCAGVSALVQTAGALFRACNASEIKQTDTKNCFEIKIENVTDNDRDKVINYCDFLLTGLFLMEKHYPDYVKIIILEE